MDTETLALESIIRWLDSPSRGPVEHRLAVARQVAAVALGVDEDPEDLLPGTHTCPAGDRGSW